MLQWTELAWYAPPGNVKVISCTPPSPIGMVPDVCTSLANGYSATIHTMMKLDGGQVAKSTLQIAEAGRKDEGKWRCVVSGNGDKELSKDEFKFEVFEPAKSITCEHRLTPDGLFVECITARIYSKGVCEWEYRYHNEKNKGLNDANSDQLIFTKLTGAALDSYYTRCTLELNTRKSFDFKAGTLSVTLTMRPDVGEKPNLSIFKFENDTRLGGIITYGETKEIKIKCSVPDGISFVKTTKLQCDFLFKDENSKNLQRSVTSRNTETTVVKAMADREMHGKSCYCSGSHLTGNTISTVLKFNIQTAGWIESFQAPIISSTPIGSNNTLTCEFGGNPLPTVSIRHKGTNTELKTITTKGKTQANINVQCSSNGEYSCMVRNKVNGQVKVMERSTNLNITCSPTPCTSAYKNMTMYAHVNHPLSVHLCFYANPKIEMEKFKIYPGEQKQFALDEDEYIVEYSEGRNAWFEVSFNFSMSEDKIGTFYLYYDGDFVLDFNLDLKDKEVQLIAQNSGEFTYTNGTDLVVQVDIVGYPEPLDYTLYKAGNESEKRRIRAATGNCVDPKTYNVFYVSNTSLIGTVVLTMLNVLDTDD